MKLEPKYVSEHSKEKKIIVIKNNSLVSSETYPK